FFFFSSRRRHTRFSRDWSSDVCSSDLAGVTLERYMVSSFLCGPSAPAALQTASVFWNPARPRSRCFHLPLYPCCPPPTDKRWLRSEERRVGKECRSRWSRSH